MKYDVRCCESDLCNKLSPALQRQPVWPDYIIALLILAIVATTALIALILYTMFLVKNSLRPKIQKLSAPSCAHQFLVGMGVGGWGKAEFFNFGLPKLAPGPLKVPE